MTKEELKKNACNNFKFIRNELGIKQSELAEMLLTTRGTIGAIEEGRAVSFYHIYLLSKLVNISIETLIETDMKKQNQDILNPG